MKRPTLAPVRGRSGVALGIRLAVSVGLILWIIRTVEWGDFARTVQATDPVYLALSLAVDPVLVWISARKWQILLRARSQDAGVATCYRLYLVGFFFNNFLPTNVGGDVVRAHLMGRRTGHATDALASVFVERFTGITALVGLVLIGIPFTPERLYAAPVGWGVGALVLVYLLLLWAVLDPRFLRLTRGRTSLPLVEKIARFQQTLHAYREHPRALVACVALSVLFYLFAGLSTYFAARAFHGSLRILDALLATPVILIIVLFPVSIGGLGLLEWSYLFTLGRLGIPPAVGVSAGLLMRMKTILLSLAGAVGYLLPVGTPAQAEAGAPSPDGPGS